MSSRGDAHDIGPCPRCGNQMMQLPRNQYGHKVPKGVSPSKMLGKAVHGEKIANAHNLSSTARVCINCAELLTTGDFRSVQVEGFVSLPPVVARKSKHDRDEARPVATYVAMASPTTSVTVRSNGGVFANLHDLPEVKVGELGVAADLPSLLSPLVICAGWRPQSKVDICEDDPVYHLGQTLHSRECGVLVRPKPASSGHSSTHRCVACWHMMERVRKRGQRTRSGAPSPYSRKSRATAAGMVQGLQYFELLGGDGKGYERTLRFFKLNHLPCAKTVQRTMQGRVAAAADTPMVVKAVVDQLRAMGIDPKKCKWGIKVDGTGVKESKLPRARTHGKVGYERDFDAAEQKAQVAAHALDLAVHRQSPAGRGVLFQAGLANQPTPEMAVMRARARPAKASSGDNDGDMQVAPEEGGASTGARANTGANDSDSDSDSDSDGGSDSDPDRDSDSECGCGDCVDDGNDSGNDKADGHGHDDGEVALAPPPKKRKKNKGATKMAAKERSPSVVEQKARKKQQTASMQLFVLTIHCPQHATPGAALDHAHVYSVPIAWRFWAKSSGEKLKAVMFELFAILAEEGIFIKYLTCDGGNDNGKMLSLWQGEDENERLPHVEAAEKHVRELLRRLGLFADNEDLIERCCATYRCFVLHPITKEIVYLVSDQAHLLKTFRNKLLASTLKKLHYLKIYFDGQWADCLWAHVRTAFNKDVTAAESGAMRVLNDVTTRAVELHNSRDKMIVKLARSVIQMHDSMAELAGDEAMGTRYYLECVDRLTSTMMYRGLRTDAASFARELREGVLPFAEWQREHARVGHHKKEFLSLRFFSRVLVTVQSLPALCHDFLTDVGEFRPQSTSQDVVEYLFSLIKRGNSKTAARMAERLAQIMVHPPDVDREPPGAYDKPTSRLIPLALPSEGARNITTAPLHLMSLLRDDGGDTPWSTIERDTSKVAVSAGYTRQWDEELTELEWDDCHLARNYYVLGATIARLFEQRAIAVVRDLLRDHAERSTLEHVFPTIIRQFLCVDLDAEGHDGLLDDLLHIFERALGTRPSRRVRWVLEFVEGWGKRTEVERIDLRGAFQRVLHATMTQADLVVVRHVLDVARWEDVATHSNFVRFNFRGKEWVDRVLTFLHVCVEETLGLNWFNHYGHEVNVMGGLRKSVDFRLFMATAFPDLSPKGERELVSLVVDTWITFQRHRGTFAVEGHWIVDKKRSEGRRNQQLHTMLNTRPNMKYGVVGLTAFLTERSRARIKLNMTREAVEQLMSTPFELRIVDKMLPLAWGAFCAHGRFHANNDEHDTRHYLLDNPDNRGCNAFASVLASMHKGIFTNHNVRLQYTHPTQPLLPFTSEAQLWHRWEMEHIPVELWFLRRLVNPITSGRSPEMATLLDTCQISMLGDRPLDAADVGCSARFQLIHEGPPRKKYVVWTYHVFPFVYEDGMTSEGQQVYRYASSRKGSGWLRHGRAELLHFPADQVALALRAARLHRADGCVLLRIPTSRQVDVLFIPSYDQRAVGEAVTQSANALLRLFNTVPPDPATQAAAFSLWADVTRAARRVMHVCPLVRHLTNATEKNHFVPTHNT